MTAPDDEVVAFYAAQQLSEGALARLTHVRRTPPSRGPIRWGSGLALAAAALVGAGIGAWAVWPERNPVPLFVEALPIHYDSTPYVAPDTLRLTRVAVGDGAALAGFLSPGDYVDVLFTPTDQLQTLTLVQSALVVRFGPPEERPRTVTLQTTPEQDRQLLQAAQDGVLNITLRNDLDVSYRALDRMERWPLRRPSVPAPEGRPGELPDGYAHRTSATPVSTFAMDVDTASYARARAFLGAGRRPPPETVRVEEFVNAMPYEYPLPATDLFSASFETVPSPWTQGYHLVRIGLRARQPADREAMHLTFLIDTSGSMASHLPLVRESLRAVASSLLPGDTVALVGFGSHAYVALETTSASDPRLETVLDALVAGGSTALQDGLLTAYPLAAAGLDAPGQHRVILCTDGIANVGVTDDVALSAQLRTWTHQGIGLTALGFGNGPDAFMEAFADATDGDSGYVGTIEDARRELTHRLVVVARDAKSQVTWDPDAILAWRLVGYADRLLSDAAFVDDAVDAGDIAAGQEVTALYEVLLAPGTEGPLGILDLRAEPPGPEGQPEISQRFPIPADPRPTLEAASADTRLAVAAASFGLRLAGSPIVELDDSGISRLARHVAPPALLDAMSRTFNASTPPRTRPCREIKIISGGQTKIALVNDDGMPCE